MITDVVYQVIAEANLVDGIQRLQSRVAPCFPWRHRNQADFQAASTGLPPGENARSLATTDGTSSQARAKSPAEL